MGVLCGLVSVGWLLPHLEASREQIEGMDLRPSSYNLDLPTVLGAAVPNTIIWVVGVGYGFFNLGLGLLAEFTGFADQAFFGRWWASSYFKEFWCVLRLGLP